MSRSSSSASPRSTASSSSVTTSISPSESAAGDESFANESGDLARLATSEIVVFLDDHVVQSGGETTELADVVVATIARAR